MLDFTSSKSVDDLSTPKTNYWLVGIGLFLYLAAIALQILSSYYLNLHVDWLNSAIEWFKNTPIGGYILENLSSWLMLAHGFVAQFVTQLGLSWLINKFDRVSQWIDGLINKIVSLPYARPIIATVGILLLLAVVASFIWQISLPVAAYFFIGLAIRLLYKGYVAATAAQEATKAELYAAECDSIPIHTEDNQTTPSLGVTPDISAYTSPVSATRTIKSRSYIELSSELKFAQEKYANNDIAAAIDHLATVDKLIAGAEKKEELSNSDTEILNKQKKTLESKIIALKAAQICTQLTVSGTAEDVKSLLPDEKTPIYEANLMVRSFAKAVAAPPFDTLRTSFAVAYHTWPLNYCRLPIAMSLVKAGLEQPDTIALIKAIQASPTAPRIQAVDLIILCRLITKHANPTLYTLDRESKPASLWRTQHISAEITHLFTNIVRHAGDINLDHRYKDNINKLLNYLFEEPTTVPTKIQALLATASSSSANTSVDNLTILTHICTAPNYAEAIIRHIGELSEQQPKKIAKLANAVINSSFSELWGQDLPIFVKCIWKKLSQSEPIQYLLNITTPYVKVAARSTAVRSDGLPPLKLNTYTTLPPPKSGEMSSSAPLATITGAPAKKQAVLPTLPRDDSGLMFKLEL